MSVAVTVSDSVWALRLALSIWQPNGMRMQLPFGTDSRSSATAQRFSSPAVGPLSSGFRFPIPTPIRSHLAFRGMEPSRMDTSNGRKRRREAPVDVTKPYAIGADFHNATKDEDEPSPKKARQIRANLKMLERLPPLRDYHRASNGRRGGVDGGTLTGPMMLAALEASMQESARLTERSRAMVAPVTLARGRNGGLQVHNVRTEADPEPRTQTRGTKDDEARPAAS